MLPVDFIPPVNIEKKKLIIMLMITIMMRVIIHLCILVVCSIDPEQMLERLHLIIAGSVCKGTNPRQLRHCIAVALGQNGLLARPWKAHHKTYR